jgi:hypothetical protein
MYSIMDFKQPKTVISHCIPILMMLSEMDKNVLEPRTDCIESIIYFLLTHNSEKQTANQLEQV